MRRTPVILLATVALAFGCASSNNQNQVENPDNVADPGDAAAGSDGAGADVTAGRGGRDQTGVRGLGVPNKAVKKLAAQKPPRDDEEDETPADTPHGLLIAYYEIPAATAAMPDFTALPDADGVGLIDSVDLRGSFPGLPGSLSGPFAAHVMGSLNVVTGGEYKLCLNSSDGAQLALDGTLLVDNDGVHSAKQTCEPVYMEPGEYQLNVIYFNVSNEPVLQLSWDAGAGLEVIPNLALYKPEGADDLVR